MEYAAALNQEGGVNMNRKFITVKQLANMLHMDHQTVRRKLKAGEIPYYKIGGSILLDREEINKWINSQKVKVN